MYLRKLGQSITLKVFLVMLVLETCLAGGALLLFGFGPFGSSSPPMTPTLYLLLVGTIGIITALAAASIVDRLIVPRVSAIGYALKSAQQGNFLARVDPVGIQDELGSCAHQVNALIDTIKGYIEKLNELSRIGEELAGALNKDEIIRVIVEVVETQLAGKCVGIFDRDSLYNRSGLYQSYAERLDEEQITQLLSGQMVIDPEPKMNQAGGVAEDGDSVLLFVPLIEGDQVLDVIVFEDHQDELQITPVNREFARSLDRLINNALSRINTLKDITEAESKYRALFMTAVGGIYRVDASGKFEDINPSLAAMGGYDSVEEMLELVTDSTQVYENLEDRTTILTALEKNDRIRDYPLNFKRKDGSIFPASLSAHTVRDMQGSICAIEGYVADMTERTRREQAEREKMAAEAATQAKTEMLADLAQKNQQLEETVEEMRQMQNQLLQSEKMATAGSMAGAIAHDLNNVLAGLFSYPDLLLRKLPDDSGLKEPLQAMRTAGERAVGIVNDLLLLSKGTAQTWEFHELNVLVENCLQHVNATGHNNESRSFQFEVKLCHEKVYIRCASLPLQKAISNLIINRLECRSQAGVVQISTELKDGHSTDQRIQGLNDALYAVITVQGDGARVEQEHLERLLLPFHYREPGEQKEQTGCGGLGLAIAWNIIQEHHGRITVDTTSDGSIFTVYLPISDELPDPVVEGESSSEDIRGSGSILVVDDEGLQREIAGNILAELGYDVFLVSSGEAAIKYLEKQVVDLVLLDMLMPPGINGRITYEGIHSRNPAQKVLLTSGFSQSGDIDATLAMGAGSFLKKPYTFQQLGEAVRDELARK